MAGNFRAWRSGPSWCLVIGLTCTAAELRAQPAPVLAGAWDVQTLVTFDRLPTAAATVTPAVGIARPAPQSRKYRICIGPERARSPMLPQRLPPAAELVFDGQSYTGSFDDAGAARPQVDITYRRLSATAFEGSQDAMGEGVVARTQYFAQYGGPNCGATRPGWPADSGEP
jgi:hypothetical protein